MECLIFCWYIFCMSLNKVSDGEKYYFEIMKRMVIQCPIITATILPPLLNTDLIDYVDYYMNECRDCLNL